MLQLVLNREFINFSFSDHAGLVGLIKNLYDEI